MQAGSHWWSCIHADMIPHVHVIVHAIDRTFIIVSYHADSSSRTSCHATTVPTTSILITVFEHHCHLI